MTAYGTRTNMLRRLAELAEVEAGRHLNDAERHEVEEITALLEEAS